MEGSSTEEKSVKGFYGTRSSKYRPPQERTSLNGTSDDDTANTASSKRPRVNMTNIGKEKMTRQRKKTSPPLNDVTEKNNSIKKAKKSRKSGTQSQDIGAQILQSIKLKKQSVVRQPNNKFFRYRSPKKSSPVVTPVQLKGRHGLQYKTVLHNGNHSPGSQPKARFDMNTVFNKIAAPSVLAKVKVNKTVATAQNIADSNDDQVESGKFEESDGDSDEVQLLSEHLADEELKPGNVMEMCPEEEMKTSGTVEESQSVDQLQLLETSGTVEEESQSVDQLQVLETSGTVEESQSVDQLQLLETSGTVEEESQSVDQLQLPSQVPHIAKEMRRQVLKDNNNVMVQTVLDAGQKSAGEKTCPTCGMMFSVACDKDSAAHRQHHNSRVTALRFPGWKSEVVCQEFADMSRIIVVSPEQKAIFKKVEAIRAIVDEDLGFVSSGKPLPPMSKIFLHISGDKQVTGFCVAQIISQAHRVMSDDGDNASSPKKRRRPWCCSTQPERARCGINRIWTVASARRKKVATRLVECIRSNFLMGSYIKIEEMAFSDPTPDGQAFAEKITGTKNFLVYSNTKYQKLK